MQESQWTGVIIGHETISKFRGVHIATAGHVLDGFGEGTSVWTVSRIERDEEGQCSEYLQTFRDVGTWTSFPKMMVSGYLRDCDIGLIAVENKADGDEGRLLIDPVKYPPLKVIPTTGYLQQGAKVAWAGFPGFVSEITDAFQLCYFEGIVACVPPRPAVYLVDGHTTPGVSGGPMWILQEDGEPIIAGVCIHYASKEKPFPGLVGFCPLQILLRHIDEMHSRPS